MPPGSRADCYFTAQRLLRIGVCQRVLRATGSREIAIMAMSADRTAGAEAAHRLPQRPPTGRPAAGVGRAPGPGAADSGGAVRTAGGQRAPAAACAPPPSALRPRD